MNVPVWAGLFRFSVIFLLAFRWRMVARARDAEAEHESVAHDKAKRRADTALNELRDLREALTPNERIRVERRRADSPGPQGRPERRKQSPASEVESCPGLSECASSIVS